MKNKNYIIGAVGAVVGILLIILVIILWGGRGDETPETEVNPFGDTSATRSASSTIDDPFGDIAEEWLTKDPEDTEGESPVFRAITNLPSLAPTIISKTNEVGTAEYVRYIDRMSGHLMESSLRTVVAPKTLTFNTVLRVGEALWAPNGNTTMLRYLDEEGETIYTYLGWLETVGTSSQTTFDGRTLPNNIITAAFSPTGSSVFYIVPTDEGAVGYVESVSTGSKTQVWSSPLRSITAQWLSADTIVVYTNPTLSTTGFVWTVSPSSGARQIVLAEGYSLAALPSPSGQRLLYSMRETQEGLPTLRVLELGSGEVTHMPVPSLVEKCVWGPNGSEYLYCATPSNMSDRDYLDKWYQGALSSNDTVWRFNVVTGASKELVNPLKETQLPFDIVELAVGENEEYLVFREKKSSWIWAVEIPQKKDATSEQATSTEEVAEDA